MTRQLGKEAEYVPSYLLRPNTHYPKYPYIIPTSSALQNDMFLFIAWHPQIGLLDEASCRQKYEISAFDT